MFDEYRIVPLIFPEIDLRHLCMQKELAIGPVAKSYLSIFGNVGIGLQTIVFGQVKLFMPVYGADLWRNR